MRKKQGGSDLYDSVHRKIKLKGKIKGNQLEKAADQYKEAVRQEGSKKAGDKMKKLILKGKSRKPSSEKWQEESSMLSEPKEKKVKRAKIKIKPLSGAVSKPPKKGKIIIRKGGKGKYVKDENYYKAKMLRAKTAGEESKYYKLMKKMMDK